MQEEQHGARQRPHVHAGSQTHESRDPGDGEADGDGPGSDRSGTSSLQHDTEITPTEHSYFKL